MFPFLTLQIDHGAGRHLRRGRVDGPEYGRTPVWV